MPRLFLQFAAVGLAIAALISTPHAQGPLTAQEDLLKTQIERALRVAVRNYDRLLPPEQAGVHVNNVQIRRPSPESEVVAIDLSQRALTYDPSGNIGPLIDAILEAAASGIGSVPLVTFHFTIDGIPLEQFLRPEAPRVARRALPLTNGGTMLISPGHGVYWDDALGTWHLQRPRILGIVEDLVNWDIARDVRDELVGAGINARMTRYAEQDDIAGPSTSPRWEEGAKYFIEMLGAPADVWNFGADDYARDINSRPFFANWIDATAIISIHNNGGQETGTETWYDETNGWQNESSRLAEVVNRHVVSSIRARYNANWVDRGLRTCDGCKGENRLASRPAVIVEIAYMDTPTPDNDALHDEAFKHIVAQAIREAVHEWAYR